MASRKLWVFRVSGGESFKLQAKGNPPMVHDGAREAVLRSICTAEEADDLETQMVRRGSKVSKHCPMETQQQTVERKNVLQVLGGERNFPCERCPECAWFDPHLESLCGAGLAFGKAGYDDTIKGSMSSEKYREDFEACPLREEQFQ